LNPPPTTAISTLSLHDALPICLVGGIECLFVDGLGVMVDVDGGLAVLDLFHPQTGRVVIVLPDLLSILQDPGQAVLRVVFVLPGDRKSTRLNSSHVKISYAVFC